MNLTPLDVRRKEFDKAFRGYDPTEVDLFLKQVADRLEEVQEEARRTEEKTREAEAKLVHYEKVELALQEALESARESARRQEASAEEKARLIVQEAELRAEKIIHDAERERYGLRQDVSKLTARQAEIAARLRGFLFSELEVLAQFQGDDPVGFIKLQPAGGHAPSLPPPPARLEAPISDLEDAPDDDWPESERWDEPARMRSAEPTRDAPRAPEPEAPEPPARDASAPEAPAPEAPAPEPPSAEPPDTDAPSPEPAERPASQGEESFPSTEAQTAEAQTAEAPAPSPAERPSAPPLTGAYASAEETPRPDPPSPERPRAPAEAPTPPAVTGGWDLRSLVTGEERSVTASDEEREAIRRILDDLD